MNNLNEIVDEFEQALIEQADAKAKVRKAEHLYACAKADAYLLHSETNTHTKANYMATLDADVVGAKESLDHWEDVYYRAWCRARILSVRCRVFELTNEEHELESIMD